MSRIIEVYLQASGARINSSLRLNDWLIFGLFNECFHLCQLVSWLLILNWKRFGRKQRVYGTVVSAWRDSGNPPNSNRYNWSPGWDSNRGRTAYFGVL